MRFEPKLWSVLATAALLLCLLSWLLWRGLNPEGPLIARAGAALDDYALAESALRRDVLSARAGLLRDYDPLVREVASLNAAIARLGEFQSAYPESDAAISALTQSIARQERLTEQFKTDNALLQNSLAYFGMFSATPAGHGPSAGLSPAVSALAAAVLGLTLDGSPENAAEVGQRLDDLAAAAEAAGSANMIDPLLAHGRLLRDLLPATDRIVKTIAAVPDPAEENAVRDIVRERHAAAEQLAQKFRLLLFAAAVLLLGLLIEFGRRLRARGLALRKRAALEHVIASISTEFINARPDDLDGQIERALGRLAVSIGADRAYFLLPGTPGRIYRWCRAGIGYPSGWIEQVAALAATIGPREEGIVHVPHVRRLPPGPEREALTGAGLRSWASASTGRSDGALLGFDSLAAGFFLPADEFNLLRMALDAIANALGRRFLERDRARLAANLQQARRMETIGALASGVAHNFNNIISAILGYIEMAEAAAASDQRSIRHLAEIRRAGERARGLVDQILAFGRQRDPCRQPVAVNAIIAEGGSMLRASLPGTIKLELREMPEHAVISGEPGQLQQVVLNLCNNAAQAMDERGDIVVEAALVESPGPIKLSHGTLAAGRYARVSVADSGRGMSEAVIERIFEPFFTTRADGNGLGLATVREIVTEHGGAMHVASKPVLGSRFEAWFPCSIVAAAEQGRPPENLPLGRGETVLMVDEDETRLMREEEVLAALGYEPVGYSKAREAELALSEAPRRFDAVLLSQMARPEAALVLAAALRRISPTMPILLAKSSGEAIDEDALLDAGILEVVRRPLVSVEIAAALRRTLASSRPMTAA